MSGAAVRRVVINTPKAPAAIGAYSQAVLVDKTMYISGQIGFDPKTMNIVGGGKVSNSISLVRHSRRDSSF